MLGHFNISDEISGEGVSKGTSLADVLFGINMHEALKLPLIRRKKTFGIGPINQRAHMQELSKSWGDLSVSHLLHCSKELVL